MKIHIYLLLALLLITACAPTPQAVPDTASTIPPDTAVTSPPEQPAGTDEPMQNPFSPMPGDSNLTRGKAFVQEASLLIRESFPPQITLNIKGELPTPCHQLRADIREPTSDNKVNIEVYSVVNPDLMCTQVIKPFEENIDLGTFPSGHYSVFVNEEAVGEFDS